MNTGSASKCLLKGLGCASITACEQRSCNCTLACSEPAENTLQWVKSQRNRFVCSGCLQRGGWLLQGRKQPACSPSLPLAHSPALQPCWLIIFKCLLSGAAPQGLPASRRWHLFSMSCISLCCHPFDRDLTARAVTAEVPVTPTELGTSPSSAIVAGGVPADRKHQWRLFPFQKKSPSRCLEHRGWESLTVSLLPSPLHVGWRRKPPPWWPGWRLSPLGSFWSWQWWKHRSQRWSWSDQTHGADPMPGSLIAYVGLRV